MHQSHLDFIKQRMCGLLSLLLPLENLATDVPQLGKDSVQRIVKSMTLEEKASLLVGLSMEDYGGDSSTSFPIALPTCSINFVFHVEASIVPTGNAVQ